MLRSACRCVYVWLALGISVSSAQNISEAPAPATLSILKLNPTPLSQFQYRSIFTDYQGFTEQVVSPWRETNDTVEKIGGWRVYAREVRLPDTAEQPAAKAGKTETHGEHGTKP